MNLVEKAGEEAGKTQVLVFAGGKARRMGCLNVPKPLIEVNGKPLIDICVEYLRDNGFSDFVLLVGHGHEKIREHVGEGERYGVRVRYSVDPPLKHVGKGKALKHAIETGVVDRSRRALIAFPDDVFLDKSLPLRLLLYHVENVRLRGTLATVVVSSAINYPYGVAEVDEDGLVKEFKEKPVIRMYTSTGLYVFEPGVYDLVVEMVSMSRDEVMEFENTVLPELARRGRVCAFTIPNKIWYPVNTLKDLDKLVKVLNSHNL